METYIYPSHYFQNRAKAMLRDEAKAARGKGNRARVWGIRPKRGIFPSRVCP